MGIGCRPRMEEGRLMAGSLLAMAEWIQTQGELGIVIYVVLFAVVVAFSVPLVTPLETMPGFLFGFWPGFFANVVGKNVGSILAMAISRFLFRSWVRDTFAKRSPSFRIIERILGRGGFMPVFMVRMVFLPMSVKNYGLGAMDVPLATSISAAILSSLPFAMFWAYLGTLAKDLAEIVDGRRASLDLPSSYSAALMVGAGVGLAVMAVAFRREWQRVANEIAQEEAQSRAKLE